MTKYEYNEEWWKSITNVDNPVCPECEGGITKIGDTYHCDRCDLVVTGNPMLVSYRAIPELEKSEAGINYSVCPECGATRQGNKFKFEEIEDELVCLGCGLVLDGPQMDVNYPFRGLLSRWDTLGYK